MLHWERAQRPIRPTRKRPKPFGRRLLVDEVPVDEGAVAKLVARAGGALSLGDSVFAALLLWEIVGAASLVAILAGNGRAARRYPGGSDAVVLLALCRGRWQWQRH